MKLQPQHSPRPWYRHGDQVVDRNHDPVCTLQRERLAGDQVRLVEESNASAILSVPSMLAALIQLADELREGACNGHGLEPAECAFLAGLATGEIIAAIGLEAMKGGAS